MDTFKEIMGVVNITLSSVLFGAGIVRVFTGDYRAAAYLLLAVSILFIVGYFAERWSE